MTVSERRIYKDAYFLIFDIENKLDIKIDERTFSVRITNSAFIEEKTRLYVPFQVIMNRKKYDCEEIAQLLGFMPLMNVTIRHKMSEVTIALKPKALNSVLDVSALISKATNYAMMNNAITGGSEEDLEKIEAALRLYSYSPKREGNVIKYNNSEAEAKDAETKDADTARASGETLVSNEPLSKLMTLKPASIIRPQYKRLYNSYKDETYNGENISIGYYIYRNGEIISLAAQQHLAIFDGRKRRIADILE